MKIAAGTPRILRHVQIICTQLHSNHHHQGKMPNLPAYQQHQNILQCHTSLGLMILACFVIIINAIIGEIIDSDAEVKFRTNQAIYQQIYITIIFCITLCNQHFKQQQYTINWLALYLNCTLLSIYASFPSEQQMTIFSRLLQQLRSVTAPLNRFNVLWRHRNHHCIILLYYYYVAAVRTSHNSIYNLWKTSTICNVHHRAKFSAT